MFDIPEAISAGSNLISTIVNKFAPDANLEEQGKLTAALTEMQNQYAIILNQIEVNKVEAASPSFFVAGWRPFIGWTCGAGLAYVSLIEPVSRFIAVVIFAYTGTFPVISTEITLQILMGMLGLGAQRSYEKAKGVDTKKVGK